MTDNRNRQDFPIGFYVSAFAIDGEMEGSDFFDFSSLSPEWLKICSDYLSARGDNFNSAWSGPLAHIETKLTSVDGVALLTVNANGIPVASAFLSAGKEHDTELSVMKMFINSLRGVNLVKGSASTTEPFQKLLSIVDRPLMAVVPWPSEKVSDSDHSLVAELCLHISGSFFLRNMNNLPK